MDFLEIAINNLVPIILFYDLLNSGKRHQARVAITHEPEKAEYSETCLNQTSLEPTYVFRIDRCSVYIG